MTNMSHLAAYDVVIIILYYRRKKELKYAPLLTIEYDNISNILLPYRLYIDHIRLCNDRNISIILTIYIQYMAIYEYEHEWCL